MITPKIKHIDLSSPTPWESFTPVDIYSYGFYLTATIGPSQSEAGELFQILICSPKWREYQNLNGNNISERHFEFEGIFNRLTIQTELSKFIESCSGENWQEVVNLISRKAEWEFE
jgi:hypothetical protein